MAVGVGRNRRTGQLDRMRIQVPPDFFVEKTAAIVFDCCSAWRDAAVRPFGITAYIGVGDQAARTPIGWLCLIDVDDRPEAMKIQKLP